MLLVKFIRLVGGAEGMGIMRWRVCGTRDGLSITERFGHRHLILLIIVVIHGIQLNQMYRVDFETVCRSLRLFTSLH